jgi:iron complex outermembrane receptor protein
VPFGNYSAFELRGNASGAIVPDTLAASVAFSYATRDGYTVNTITNDDLDSRDAISGKGQLLWKPAENWLARVIVTAERAEDGDYGLNDLEALRQNPHQSTRDYEGYVDRSVFATSILTEKKGSRFNVATTTGFVRWTTEDSTDLDYTLVPIVTRLNAEDDFQFTQEVRVSSAAPTRLNDAASLRWQTGAFFFTQNYHQDAANTFAPFILSQFVEFPVTRYSPVAELDDVGFGLYGQGTVTLNENWDLTAGLRFDYENKDADLKTFYDPAIAPPAVTVASDSFSNVSPQVSAAYRLQPNASVYGTIARGYKAGGFNPISPAGSEAYGEESTWNYEGGYKVRLMEDRVAINAAAFIIDWSDLQLNLPSLASPGEFYIANAGSAQSKGLEFDVTARPAPGVDVFAAFGYTHARFSNGSIAGGADVSGNEIPNTPDYTASFGAQYTRNVFEGTAYGRADVSIYGGFHYDEANTESQDAYSLVNLRGGFRRNIFLVEGWVKNLFDINYIPVAFAYGQLAPSGFVGENGAPRTFGVRAGVTF